MIPRQHPLSDRAELFGFGGASGHADANTMESFELAERLGATGVHTRVRLTSDGVPVLRHEPTLGGIRRRKVSDVARSDLPKAVVTTEEFLERLGGRLSLMCGVSTDEEFTALLNVVTQQAAFDSVWVLAPSMDTATHWRDVSPAIRLVDTTAVSAMNGGVERHAADLRANRIEAMALPQSDWNGGRVAMMHRFGRRCFAHDAPHERMIVKMLHLGMDAVSSMHPDRLADAALLQARPDAPELLDE